MERVAEMENAFSLVMDEQSSEPSSLQRPGSFRIQQELFETSSPRNTSWIGIESPATAIVSLPASDSRSRKEIQQNPMSGTLVTAPLPYYLNDKTVEEGNPLLERFLHDAAFKTGRKKSLSPDCKPAADTLDSEPLTENPYVDLRSSELDKINFSSSSLTAGAISSNGDILPSSDEDALSSSIEISFENINDFWEGDSFNLSTFGKSDSLKDLVQDESVDLQSKKCSEAINSSNSCFDFLRSHSFGGDSGKEVERFCKRQGVKSAGLSTPLTDYSESPLKRRREQTPFRKIISSSEEDSPIDAPIDSSGFVSHKSYTLLQDKPDHEMGNLSLGNEDSALNSNEALPLNYCHSSSVSQNYQNPQHSKKTDDNSSQQQGSSDIRKPAMDEDLKQKFHLWLIGLRQNTNEIKCNASKPATKLQAPPFKKPALKTQKIDPHFGSYKAPRRIKPRPYVTNRLYKFLEKQMAPKYGLEARLKAEEFVSFMCKNVETVIRRKTNYHPIVETLRDRMVHLTIIRRQIDFHLFVEKFLPPDFRVKAIPCTGCPLGPPSYPQGYLYKDLSLKKRAN